jgi:hypothetical protein
MLGVAKAEIATNDCVEVIGRLCSTSCITRNFALIAHPLGAFIRLGAVWCHGAGVDAAPSYNLYIYCCIIITDGSQNILDDEILPYLTLIK